MLNNNIVVRDNEVVKYDVDHYMDKQLSMFQEIIKGIEKDKMTQFRNWVKVFKTLNYDIIDNLEIKNIYRFNKQSAVVELEFNKKIEYDFIVFNEHDFTVTIMNVKGGQVDKHVIRRMLLPTTVDEALMYLESEIENETIDSLAITYKELMKSRDKYKLSDGLSKHLLSKVEFNIKETKPENKPVEKKETKSIPVEPKFTIEKKETKPVVNKPVEKKETKPIVNKPVEKKETKQSIFNRPLCGKFNSIKRDIKRL